MSSEKSSHPVEIEKNGYSITSFCNRDEENQRHGMTRPYEEALGIEQASHNEAFFEDTLRIQNSREWRRLQGIYQFDVGSSYEHENRLTHTVDVQNVAERIARGINLDRHSVDLARSIAAIHDIGHMPFGHWGERAAAAKLKPFNKEWTHDAAGLRVVTEWSNRGLSHSGLNLTLDTLEGLAKRYWRYNEEQPASHFNHNLAELPDSIREIDKKYCLHLKKHNHIEGQIAAVADWIAFTGTDIEDGLRVGRMTVNEVCEHFPQAAKLYAETVQQLRIYANINGKGALKQASDTRQASLAKLFAGQIKSMLINDVAEQTKINIAGEVATGHLRTADDIRNLEHLLVGYSPEMLQGIKLFGKYCNDKVFQRTLDAHGPIQEIVELTIQDIVEGKMKLPGTWEKEADQLRSSGDSPDTKAALTELACTYMTCVMDDDAVKENVRKNHPEFWGQHFADKSAPPRILPAGIASTKSTSTMEGRSMTNNSTNRINQGSVPVLAPMSLHEFLDLPAGAVICSSVSGGDSISVIRPPSEIAKFALGSAGNSHAANDVVMARKLDAVGKPDEVQILSKLDFLANYRLQGSPLEGEALWNALPRMRKISFENLAQQTTESNTLLINVLQASFSLKEAADEPNVVNADGLNGMMWKMPSPFLLPQPSHKGSDTDAIQRGEAGDFLLFIPALNKTECIKQSDTTHSWHPIAPNDSQKPLSEVAPKLLDHFISRITKPYVGEPEVAAQALLDELRKQLTRAGWHRGEGAPLTHTNTTT